jgi:hypothetical protein
VNLARGAVKGKDLNGNGYDLLSLQSGEYFLYDAVFSPSLKPSVNGIPLAKLSRQGPPFATVFRHIQDGGYKCKVVDSYVTALARKEWCNALKLFCRNSLHKAIKADNLVCVNTP